MMKNALRFAGPLLIAGLLLGSGCLGLWQREIEFSSFLIEAPRSGAPAEKAVASKLWIGDVTVLPPFNVRNFILRRSDVEYSATYRSELLMTPSANFRNVLYRWYSESGLFGEVAFKSRLDAALSLFVSVTDFHGDIAEGKAVIEMHFILVDERGDSTGKVLFAKTYREEEPVKSMEAADLVRAYDRALSRIMAASEKDVVAALE